MKEKPVQSALSAYFNMQHRRLPGPLGHSARAQWLDANFGGLEMIQNGSKYVCVLPEIYYLQPDMASHMETMLIHFMGASNNKRGRTGFQRDRFIPVRLEMTADSLRESIGNLHKTVIKLSLYDELRRYKPKDGQDRSMLISHRSYAMVRQSDPLHDHSSIDLIDFSAPLVTPRLQRVRMYDFDNYHSHLLNPKCE